MTSSESPPSRCSTHPSDHASSHSQQCSINIHIPTMNTERMLQCTFSSGIRDYRSHICLSSTLIHPLFRLIYMDCMQMCASLWYAGTTREMMHRLDRNGRRPRTCLLIDATNGENMTGLDFTFLRQATSRKRYASPAADANEGINHSRRNKRLRICQLGNETDHRQ